MSGPPIWTPDGPWLAELIGPDAVGVVHPSTRRGLARALKPWRVADGAMVQPPLSGLVYTTPEDAPLHSLIDSVRDRGWIVEIAFPVRGLLARIGMLRGRVRVEAAERRARLALESGGWALEQWPAPDAADPHVVTLWRHRARGD